MQSSYSSERRRRSGLMFEDLLQDLRHIHRAEVTGDVSLGVGVAADRGQNRRGIESQRLAATHTR